jgi:hypothetical protein
VSLNIDPRNQCIHDINFSMDKPLKNSSRKIQENICSPVNYGTIRMPGFKYLLKKGLILVD